MNDTLKSKTRQATKAVSTKMTLDAALKTIEEADALIKNEISILASHPAGKPISTDEIVISACKKIVITTVASYAASGFAVLAMDVDMVSMIIIPGLGFLSLVGVAALPGQFARIFSPKKSKELKRQAEIDTMFNKLAKEEFQRKEQEILQNTKRAWDFANKELADQGYSVLYSSNSGFSVESTKPLNASQWDTLRLEAVRAKGVKAVGIRPKTKELTT